MKKSRIGGPTNGTKRATGEPLPEPIRLMIPGAEVLMRLLRRAMGPGPSKTDDSVPKMPSRDQLQAMAQIIGLGMAVVPELLRLKELHHDDASLCLEIDEVVLRIKLDYLADRTSRRDTASIREIVAEFCNLPAEREECNVYALMLRDDFGTAAVPELVAIASEDDYDLAVAALAFLLDITETHRGDDVLLDIVPVIWKNMTSISAIDTSKIPDAVLQNTDEATMLVVLAAEHYTQLQPLLHSLDLLELLCRQFPENERISDVIGPLLELELSKDPVLNKFVKDRISGNLGIKP
jgi:hypothetical protein